MTIATRAAFTGAIPDAYPWMFTLTAAPHGGWIRAAHYGGVDHIVYPVESSGDIEIIAWDQATRTLTGPVVIAAAFHNDAHSAPSVLVRSSDQRLMIWYSEHNGPTIYQRVSTDPLDISSWGAATSLDAALGGAYYTYPNAFEYGGKLWMFYRDAPTPGVEGHMCYSTSTDGGATWAAQTTHYVVSGQLAYFGVALTDRLDVLAADGHPAQTTTSVYHMYYDGTWRRTDGTALSGSPPYDETDPTLVYDGSDGSAGLIDLARDATTGYPVAAYSVDESGTTTGYRRAHWNGSMWISHPVVDAYAAPPGGSGRGFKLYRPDPDIAYASRPVSGVMQLHRMVTADAGATWSSEQLTFGASHVQLPYWINDVTPRLKMLALVGDYVDSGNYSVGIMGTRR